MAIKELIDDMEDNLQEDEFRLYEGSILNALLDTAGYADDSNERYTIRIRRQKNGEQVTMFTFDIRPLSEDEWNTCRKKNTKKKRDRRYGIDREEVDNVRFRSQVIYAATVAENGSKIWDNREAQEKLNVASGVDLIDKVLKSGEKDAVVEKIEIISGYGGDGDLVGLVKN